jgi:transposase InsO family protein
VKGPEADAAIRRLLGASPAVYGYRQILALRKRHGLVCAPKTVWRVMRRCDWRPVGSSVRSGRQHEGQMRVAEPNRLWASDMADTWSWDGQEGRVAIMIGCADQLVLAWRIATRSTDEDFAKRLREAVFWRFEEAPARTQGIECLSDNGPAGRGSR